MRGFCFLWEHTDSNRGPSACKADALNQLSYAPNIFEELFACVSRIGSANIWANIFLKKIFSNKNLKIKSSNQRFGWPTPHETAWSPEYSYLYNLPSCRSYCCLQTKPSCFVRCAAA